MPQIARATRRRTAPGDEEVNQNDMLLRDDDEPTAPGVESEARKAVKLPFWDHLDSLSQEECERRKVVIYRYVDGKKETLPGKSKKYLAFMALPMDGSGCHCLRQYIAEKFGGGYYEIFLKVAAEGQRLPADDHHLMGFEVDGPPKYPTDADAAPVAAPAAVAAPGGIAGGLSTDAQLELIRATINRPQQDDMSANAAKRAVETVVDILGAAAKKDAGSMSGNAIVDQLITKSLDRALNPSTAAPADPMATLAAQLESVKRISDIINPRPAAPAARREAAVDGSNPFAYAKDIAEAFKLDPQGRFLDALRPAEEAPGFQQLIVSYGMKALETRPDLPAQLADGLIGILQRVIGGLGAPPAAPLQRQLGNPQQPALPAAPRVENPTPPQVPATVTQTDNATLPVADARPSPAQQEAMVQEILRMLARAFTTGATGENAAYSLACLFPEVIPDMTKMLDMEDTLILSWLNTQPAISGVTGDPEFLQFFGEFKAQMLRGFGEESDQGEQLEDEGEAEDEEAAQPAPGAVV